jgi:hypothetical protein
MLWVTLLLVHLMTFPGRCETTRTQTVQLRQGWNAVYLEVYPLDPDPAIVFSNAPIDIAAAYYAHASAAQFMGNPGADLFKKQGWGVWYARNRPDAFLKSLHAIYGQQGYLIHAKSDYTWNITGSAVPPDVHWEVDAYSFVGFSVSLQGPPTFAQFFAGSPAHAHNKIYRLTDGVWRRVLDPSAETLRSGEAFWIYCSGASKYQGPLAVETAVRSGLVLGSGGDVLTLRNQTDHPVTPTVEHVPSGGSGVPLSITIQVVGAADAPVRSVAAPKPEGAWAQPLPALEAGAALRMPFEVRVEDVRSPVQSSLLRISTELGTETWIPVATTRPDLEDK